MTIEKFYVRTVTITNPAIVAGYGSSTELDYAHGTTSTTRGWLAPGTSTEVVTASRDAAISTHTLRVPLDSPITSRSRITVDGTPYDVIGPPAEAWTPRGGHHLRVELRAIDG